MEPVTIGVLALMMGPLVVLLVVGLLANRR